MTIAHLETATNIVTLKQILGQRSTGRLCRVTNTFCQLPSPHHVGNRPTFPTT